MSIYESNRLSYVEWDKLTSKEQEMLSTAKKETVLSIDAHGKLKTEKPEDARADTSTELLLQQALQRRGIAMEMANLLDFNVHGKWVERLLSARLDAVPATHVVPSFGQLQLADRKLFQMLAEQSRSGLQATPKGRPLDLIFEAAWLSPEVSHILQPMPRPAGAAKIQDLPDPSTWPERPGPYGGGKGRKGSTGRGKGKGKQPSKALSVHLVFFSVDLVLFGGLQ